MFIVDGIFSFLKVFMGRYWFEVLLKWFFVMRMGCFVSKLFGIYLSVGFIGKFIGVIGLVLLEFCAFEDFKLLGLELEKFIFFLGFLFIFRK